MSSKYQQICWKIGAIISILVGLFGLAGFTLGIISRDLSTCERVGSICFYLFLVLSGSICFAVCRNRVIDKRDSASESVDRNYENLQPLETEILGAWIVNKGKVQSDRNEKRIDWLIHHSLLEISKDYSGWEALYQDPRDGRLWERTYPHSELHGGGPKRLSVITEDTAKQKYNFNQEHLGTRTINV